MTTTDGSGQLGRPLSATFLRRAVGQRSLRRMRGLHPAHGTPSALPRIECSRTLRPTIDGNALERGPRSWLWH